MKLIKSFSKKVADFQAFIILSIAFFILGPVFSLILKRGKKEEKLSWNEWSMPSDTISQLKKQY